MELGTQGSLLQGLDYAYTLQGWLKGVNSADGDPTLDMGQDGVARGLTPNLTVSRDAYAYSLGYYTGDYTPIGGSGSQAFALTYSQTTGDITGQSLYNGNISNTTLANGPIYIRDGSLADNAVAYTYHYDQLNRLKKLRQYTAISGATSWDRSYITLNDQENITYDGNGNILTYGRNGGDTTAQTIDSLTYNYNYTAGKLVNNQLQFIHDAVTSSGYNLDLRNQTDSSNYLYDGMGNIIHDSGSTIRAIDWTVYNKPDSIIEPAGIISYAYNTANQRISKTFNGLTTWYVRDAQGNVLSIYDNTHGNTNWREQHLYGSSRLGMWMPNIDANTGNALSAYDTIGKKIYQLDNHLSNTMETISDVRFPNSRGGTHAGPTAYFTATVLSSQDYYAFGMLMPDRQYTLSGDSSYRYGFNGKEYDNEVMGLGNFQDYGDRIYDPRRAGFGSVDPLTKNYPWYAPYQFAGNTPIQAVDFDGLEPAYPGKFDRMVMGRDGDLRRPLTDPEGLAYFRRKTEKGAADKNGTAMVLTSYLAPLGQAATTIITGRNEKNQKASGIEKATAAIVLITPFAGGEGEGEGEGEEGGEGGNKPRDAMGFMEANLLSERAFANFKENLPNSFKGIDNEHLQAAIGDLNGKPINIGGKAYNHLDDIIGHLRSLNGKIQKLNKLINSNAFIGRTLNEAVELRSNLQTTYDSYSQALTRAANKVGVTLDLKKK